MLSALLLIGLASFALGGVTAPASLLVGYGMDGTGADIPDYSTSNIIFTAEGQLFHNLVGGIFNGFMDFQEGWGRINIDTTKLNAWGGTNCWTMMTWIKTPWAFNDGYLLKNGETSGMLTWGFDATGVQKFIWMDTALTLTDTAPLAIGRWQHIAVSRNANTFRMWRDGVVVATGTSAVMGTATIGCLGVGMTYQADCSTQTTGHEGYLVGAMVDDLFIWTSEIDPACANRTGANGERLFASVINNVCPILTCTSVSPSVSASVTLSPSVSPSAVSPSTSVSATVSASAAAAGALAGIVGTIKAEYTATQKLTLGLGVGFVAGLIFLAMLIVGLVYLYKRRRAEKQRAANKLASSTSKKPAPKSAAPKSAAPMVSASASASAPSASSASASASRSSASSQSSASGATSV